MSKAPLRIKELMPVSPEVPYDTKRIKRSVPRSASQIRDHDVRRVLRNELSAYAAKINAVMIEELGIAQGAVRIDLALVNGALHGYEIKSDRDTLERLPFQRHAYGKVFDRVTLIVGNRLLDEAKRHIPKWWGLSVVIAEKDEVTCIKTIRTPSPNPNVDARTLVELLWRDEALALLEKNGLVRGLAGKSRKLMWDRLAKELTIDQIRSAVTTAIKSRPTWLKARASQLIDDELNMMIGTDHSPSGGIPL